MSYLIIGSTPCCPGSRNGRLQQCTMLCLLVWRDVIRQSTFATPMNLEQIGHSVQLTQQTLESRVSRVQSYPGQLSFISGCRCSVFVLLCASPTGCHPFTIHMHHSSTYVFLGIYACTQKFRSCGSAGVACRLLKNSAS